ncbi:hypothetical protein Leryth_024420 [Lithospermum erythrorhizon]|nr:hypothetical protein Leryth_024420 [Lithospermum erythrorhizon]
MQLTLEFGFVNFDVLGMEMVLLIFVVVMLTLLIQLVTPEIKKGF